MYEADITIPIWQREKTMIVKISSSSIKFRIWTQILYFQVLCFLTVHNHVSFRMCISSACLLYNKINERPGDLRTKDSFLTVLGSKFKIVVRRFSVRRRSTFSLTGGQSLTVNSSHGRRGKEALWGFFHKGICPHSRRPLSWPKSSPRSSFVYHCTGN